MRFCHEYLNPAHGDIHFLVTAEDILRAAWGWDRDRAFCAWLMVTRYTHHSHDDFARALAALKAALSAQFDRHLLWPHVTSLPPPDQFQVEWRVCGDAWRRFLWWAEARRREYAAEVLCRPER